MVTKRLAPPSGALHRSDGGEEADELPGGMLELLGRLIERPSLLQRPLFEPLARLLSLALASDALRDALEATAERGGRGGEAGAAAAGSEPTSPIVTRRMARSAAPPESPVAATSDEAEPEPEPEPAACGGGDADADAAADDDDDADDEDDDDDADDVLGSGARARRAAEHARQVHALVSMTTTPTDARQIAEQFTVKALEEVLKPLHLHTVSKSANVGPARARRSISTANVRASSEQRLLELSKRYVTFFVAIRADDFELATGDATLTVEDYMCLPQTTLVSILRRRCLSHLSHEQLERTATTLRSVPKLSLAKKIVDPELARKYRPQGVASLAADGVGASALVASPLAVAALVAASSQPARSEPLTPLFPARRNSEQQGTIATAQLKRSRKRSPQNYLNAYAVPQAMFAVMKAVEAAKAVGAGTGAGAQLLLIAKLPPHGKRPARLCVCGDAILDSQGALKLLLGDVLASAAGPPESEDSQWLELESFVRIEQLAESWTTWAKGAGVAKLLHAAAGDGARLSKRARHMQSVGDAQNANPRGDDETDDEEEEEPGTMQSPLEEQLIASSQE
jgi:hypothetical protein